jgi:tetratricopeptide (TPR) repeat protein
VFERLAADFPQNLYCRWEQCFGNLNLAGLMSLLGRLNDAEKALRDAGGICENVLAQVPDDGGFRDRLARSHFELAEVLRAENRVDEAVTYYRQADAAWRKLSDEYSKDFPYRIHVIETCTDQIGPFLVKNGRVSEAEEVDRTAVGLLARIPVNELVTEDRFNLTDTCYGTLVRLLKNGNEPQKATALIRAWLDVHRKSVDRILELKPKSAAEFDNLGNALVQLGRWDEALAAIEKAAELEPANHWFLFRAAPLHLRAGDVTGYRRVCRGMLERFHETKSLQIADRTAKTCLLLRSAVPDFDRVKKLADRTVTGTEKDPSYRWYLFVKGLAEYRAGRRAEAVKWLERFGPDANGVHIDVSGFAVLAMAQHHLGQKEKARAALGNSQAIFTQKMPDPAAGRPCDGMWQDWLHCQILLREAEALLKPPQQK